jgi:hypothetical protein
MSEDVTVTELDSLLKWRKPDKVFGILQPQILADLKQSPDNTQFAYFISILECAETVQADDIFNLTKSLIKKIDLLTSSQDEDDDDDEQTFDDDEDIEGGNDVATVPAGETFDTNEDKLIAQYDLPAGKTLLIFLTTEMADQLSFLQTVLSTCEIPYVPVYFTGNDDLTLAEANITSLPKLCKDITVDAEQINQMSDDIRSYANILSQLPEDVLEKIKEDLSVNEEIALERVDKWIE